MRNGAWRVGMLSIALSGVPASQMVSHERVAAVRAQEKTQTDEVKIDNFSFTPQEITVTTGTKVTWVNRDDIPHTVVSTTDAFKSKALDTDDQYSFTFDKPGGYEYFCSIHPRMTGKVVVK
jgi:plastocyanin